MHPPATIPNTQVRTLTATRSGQVYRISIALPSSYNETRARYPVLYLLDANWYFGMVTETARLLRVLGPELPELVIVGIGYPTDADPDILRLHARDLTPTNNPEFDAWASQEWAGDCRSGGAADFLAFLRDDLMPLINAVYRVDAAKPALMGQSLGGLFALYTLFHQPDSFSRYVAASPSLWWDAGVLFQHEREFAAQPRPLPVTLFLSVGTLEETVTYPMISNVYRLMAILEEREYSGLDLITAVFDGETHKSVVPATFCRALRAIFPTVDDE
jgi:predicted alpha/beta superfamily hydrolase